LNERCVLTDLLYRNHIDAALDQQADIDSTNIVTLDKKGLVVGISLAGSNCIAIYFVRQRLQRGLMLHLFHANNIRRIEHRADRQRSLVQPVGKGRGG
jgi:hypothetical protein